MLKHLTFAAFIASMNLSGCVYRVDVEQGNIVTQEMINQLRPNMNKRQVRYVMGSPMVVDVFHQNRWDYVYSFQPGGGIRKQKRISLIFQDQLLMELQGDFRPSSEPVNETVKDMSVVVPKRVKNNTLWDIVREALNVDEL
jgi:outer membrane protein assembly factor BamE